MNRLIIGIALISIVAVSLRLSFTTWLLAVVALYAGLGQKQVLAQSNSLEFDFRKMRDLVRHMRYDAIVRMLESKLVSNPLERDYIVSNFNSTMRMVPKKSDLRRKLKELNRKYNVQIKLK